MSPVRTPVCIDERSTSASPNDTKDSEPPSGGSPAAGALLDVRDFSLDDLDSVLAIEKASFVKPLGKSGFQKEITLPFSRLRVVTDAKLVAGYINYWILDDEVHILNIAVSPDLRRKGLAKALFDDMVASTPLQSTYHLELRVSNVGALRFYEKFGFKVVGRRKAYYQNNQEDAFLMSWIKSSSPIKP